MSADEKLTDAISDIQIIVDIMAALQDAAGNKCLNTDLLLRNLKQFAADAEAATKALFAEMDALERRAA